MSRRRLRLAGDTGPKPPGTDIINRYMADVLRASQVSEEVCLRLLEVTTLLRPPSALLTPAMVPKVPRAAREPDPSLAVMEPKAVKRLLRPTARAGGLHSRNSRV